MQDNWEQPEEEYVPLNIPPEFRRLTVEERKSSVRELWQRYLAREIVLEPDFQRNYVWDVTRASRYIESLLLGLPTPSLFLSEEGSGRWIVVDGHQRLETLFRFMQPLLEGPAKVQGRRNAPNNFAPLSLRALEVLPELNGKGILALDFDDRAKLWNTELNVILLARDNHPDMKYVLFARLNQGSMSLNNQELRNCLYRGPYNNLISRLSEERSFLTIWGRDTPDKRMRHKELALRFFALLHRLDRYRVPYRAFLNDEMEANQDLKLVDENRCRAELQHALAWVERVFGGEAFKRFQVGNVNNPTGRWINRRLDLMYEVESVGFAQFGDHLDKAWGSFNSDERHLFLLELRSRLVDVMVNAQFSQTLTQNTTRAETVRQRFELWNRALEYVTQDPKTMIQRATVLHQKLREGNVCSVCPQQVSPDDAVLIPLNGNQRVAHRFCRRNQQD